MLAKSIFGAFHTRLLLQAMAICDDIDKKAIRSAICFFLFIEVFRDFV